jgi:hypothetical protein
MPQDLDQAAAAATEHEQMAIMGIVLEGLLNLQRQAVEAAPHVRVAARQPDPRTAWDRDHRRRLDRIRALISADTVERLTSPVIRIRPPVASSISIALQLTGPGDVDTGPAVDAISTGENTAADGAGPQSSRRQRNNWLVSIPAARATSDATAPGSMAAATIRSFSALDQRRRRSTDVITSTLSSS